MRCVALDSNLLVLWIVGSVRPDYIAQHKRLRAYSFDDFSILDHHLNGAALITTPNAMTEAANLIVYGVRDPLKSGFLAALRRFADIAEEEYLPSRDVAASPAYRRLGLTDAAWLAFANRPIELLTDDLALYLAASQSGMAAHNFNHLRDQ